MLIGPQLVLTSENPLLVHGWVGYLRVYALPLIVSQELVTVLIASPDIQAQAIDQKFWNLLVARASGLYVAILGQGVQDHFGISWYYLTVCLHALEHAQNDLH